MVVGIYRIALVLPQNTSLKGKRSVVRRVLDRVRARFNVTAAEVGYLDDHRRALLAFAVVSNDRRHANAMLDKIAQAIDLISTAPIAQRSLELIQVGEMQLGVMGAGLADAAPGRWLSDEPDEMDFEGGSERLDGDTRD